MEKRVKNLGFPLEIVTSNYPDDVVKRSVSTTTEPQLNLDPPAKDKLKITPLLLLSKNVLSPERAAEIVKSLENTKVVINDLISKLKLGDVNRKDLQMELETLRKHLRRTVYDAERVPIFEEIKDKHMQLKSRLQPIKRSPNQKKTELRKQ